MTASTTLPFHKLCSLLSVGEIQGNIHPLSGGFMHHMYGIITSQGKYAVKVLNPLVMHRPTARANFVRSERIANAAKEHVPAVPAIQHNGESLHEIDGNYMQAFQWVEGIVMKPDAISVEHCTKIGAILADLHLADFSSLNLEPPSPYTEEQPIDWNDYWTQGVNIQAVWVELMRESISNLYEWDAQASEAASILSANTVSHNDLDPKNVLWNVLEPTLIDWECAGYVNPMQDLIETALYWAVDATGKADSERFQAFIQAYKAKAGTLEVDWRVVLMSGFAGKLGWLSYSLRRSLGIESADEVEQQLGTEQAVATIQALHQYADQIEEIEIWLNNIA